jgi:hypothetical protein
MVYEFPEPDDGISPQTAGILLTLVAALGIGLYAVSVLIDYKHTDPLIDPNNLDSHTPAKLMETPDLWKQPEPAPRQAPSFQAHPAQTPTSAPASL